MAEAKKLPQFIAAICICIGAMGMGSVIGWTSNIGEELEKGELNGIELDLSWAGSMMCVGAAVVFIPIGLISDKFGRKLSTLILVIPFTIGWLLITFTQHSAMLLAGRFLTGMAGAAFCVCGPMYTSEIAQLEIRGTLGTFMQLFVNIGILWSNLLGWAVPLNVFCYLCTAIPIVFGLCFMFQPESPIWLLKNDKKEKAISSFARLRGKDYDASREIADIEKQIANEEQLKGHFVKTLRSKQGKKATAICLMLHFYQKLCGVDIVMFYSGAIFKRAGGAISPKICPIVIGAVMTLSTLSSAYTIEKLGRKMLCMLSAGLMSFSMFLLGIYFLLIKLADEKVVSSIGWLPLSALTLFILFFSIGLGPVPWLAPSELFPNAIMARMGAFGGTFNWSLGFFVALAFAPLNKILGDYTPFFIFSLVTGSAVFFVYFVMPETKGKTIQEIQDELGM